MGGITEIPRAFGGIRNGNLAISNCSANHPNRHRRGMRMSILKTKYLCYTRFQSCPDLLKVAQHEIELLAQ